MSEIQEEAADELKVTSTSSLSLHDQVLLRFGEKLIVESADTLRDFAKTMIILVSGIFVVYFPLLRFLGLEDVTQLMEQQLRWIIGLPPILFVMSIVSYVVAVLPMAGNISLHSQESIKMSRKFVIRVKSVGVYAGTAFFIFALILIIFMNRRLLFG